MASNNAIFKTGAFSFVAKHHVAISSLEQQTYKVVNLTRKVKIKL